MSRHVLGTAVLLVAAGLLVAACGTSAEGAGTNDTSGATTPPGSGTTSSSRPADTSSSSSTTTTSTTTTSEPPPSAGSVDGAWPGTGQVALTFDDGPDPEFTPAILEVLAEHGIPATFFVLGHSVEEEPELLEVVTDAGHAVANHTWSHPNLLGLSDSEIAEQFAQANNVIANITGAAPSCWRAPQGAFDERVLEIATGHGLEHAGWNADSSDYLRSTPEEIVTSVMDDVEEHEGGPVVVILHDGGGDRSSTVAALPELIERLDEAGYDFVSIC